MKAYQFVCTFLKDLWIPDALLTGFTGDEQYARGASLSALMAAHGLLLHTHTPSCIHGPGIGVHALVRLASKPACEINNIGQRAVLISVDETSCISYCGSSRMRLAALWGQHGLWGRNDWLYLHRQAEPAWDKACICCHPTPAHRAQPVSESMCSQCCLVPRAYQLAYSPSWVPKTWEIWHVTGAELLLGAEYLMQCPNDRKAGVQT